jgi:hypothetical protein
MYVAVIVPDSFEDPCNRQPQADSDTTTNTSRVMGRCKLFTIVVPEPGWLCMGAIRSLSRRYQPRLSSSCVCSRSG